MIHKLLIGLALLALSVAGPALSQSSSLAGALVKTASGTSFVQPRDWKLTSATGLSVLAPPETDTRVAIVDVPAAADAMSAAAAAWQAFRPDAKRPVRLVTARPARDGWESRDVIDYESSPNERAVVQAVVLRKGAAWTVLIVDGTEPTAEKRGAALAAILQSLRPAGYARESFVGRKAHPLDAARIAELKAFVETSIHELGIPGAGLALIDNGKIVYEGGVGVREIGKPAPVDADTLFMIASNTKGMSTLLLAELVDSGKLLWDQKVSEVYPAFRLGSPATTDKVLIRHLVCACTGLPRKDFEWLFNTTAATPASDTFRQLAATEPTSGFGEVFQYNNLMASAAGYIGAHILYPKLELGAAYDKAMATRVFQPLGMTATTFSMKQALAGNHASPHADDVLTGKPAAASQDLNRTIAPFRPAGGAWSSAHDMARYVENELSQGVSPDGKRLVSAASLLERRKPGVAAGEDEYYGMGLSSNTKWGVTVINHGGSLGGYKSDWVAVPEAGVGAVLLTNADNGRALLRPFMRRLLEVLYDGKPEAAGDVSAQAKRLQAELAEYRGRVTVPANPVAAADLADRYVSAELGMIRVMRAKGVTSFGLTTMTSQVASRKNDDNTISFITIDPTEEGLEFVVAERDGKKALITRDAQHEYVFTAVP